MREATAVRYSNARTRIYANKREDGKKVKSKKAKSAYILKSPRQVPATGAGDKHTKAKKQKADRD